MRKVFDGLSGLVMNEFKPDPLSGDVYFFFRTGNLVKALCWEKMSLPFIPTAWKFAPLNLPLLLNYSFYYLKDVLGRTDTLRNELA